MSQMDELMLKELQKHDINHESTEHVWFREGWNAAINALEHEAEPPEEFIPEILDMSPLEEFMLIQGWLCPEDYTELQNKLTAAEARVKELEEYIYESKRDALK